MISIGPTLVDVHTTAERCCLADVEQMAELLILVLKKIAESCFSQSPQIERIQ